MQVVYRGEFEFSWSDTGFWLNHADGHNVARFGRYGRDIHADASGRCLACAAGPQTRADWEQFCIDLFQNYNVRVAPQMRPGFLD